MKRKQVHRHREQTLVAKGDGMVGNGWSESSELADANRCTQDKKHQDPYCAALGTIFSIL